MKEIDLYLMTNILMIRCIIHYGQGDRERERERVIMYIFNQMDGMDFINLNIVFKMITVSRNLLCIYVASYKEYKITRIH